MNSKEERENPRKRRKSQCSNPVFRAEVVKVFKCLTNIKTVLSTEGLTTVIESCELSSVCQRVAEIFDISKRSVYNMIDNQTDDENKENQSIIEVQNARSRRPMFECDDFLIAMLRRTVQTFYANKEYPDVSTILAKCKEDKNFPPISKSTLRIWLKKHCKMKHRKINKKPVFLERTDIKAQRATYLREIKRFRNEQYQIFYSDETWTSPDQTRNRCWQILLDDTEYKDLFKNTYSGQVLRDMNGWTGITLRLITVNVDIMLKIISSLLNCRRFFGKIRSR